MADEWFRSGEWNDTARLDFEARLARSRSTSRAQYLRIKALALMDAGERAAAEAMFRRVTDEYPDDWVQGAAAHESLGSLLRDQGDLPGAEQQFRLALNASPTLSGTTGEVHIALGEVILALDPSRAEEVEALLAAAVSHVTLNSTAFRWNVLKARTSAAIGDRRSARSFASSALALVDSKPQFSRHPTVGIVRPPENLLAELTALASA